MWIEMLENGLETISDLLTKENLVALLDFKYRMMQKIAEAGLEALKDPSGIEIPYSHIGYYGGFVVGFIIEEILIAFFTAGTGNIAQATNLAMQSFSQTIKVATKFTKKGAMELANTLENFLELFSQLRNEAKNVNTLFKKLDE
jgi:hypothetical protein